MKKLFVFALLFLQCLLSGQNCAPFVSSKTTSGKFIVKSDSVPTRIFFNLDEADRSTWFNSDLHEIVHSFDLVLHGMIRAGLTYNLGYGDDPWISGPDSQNDLYADSLLKYCSFWNRTFDVSDQEVFKAIEEIYNTDLTLSTMIDEDSIPKSVLLWPAKENPYFKKEYGIQLHDTHKLAFFYDHDQDGIYDPLKGDLPMPEKQIFADMGQLIACIPENMTYWIRTLDYGIQLAGHLYSYRGERLDNVYFLDYYLYAGRMIEEFFGFTASLLMDVNLGNKENDYFGIIPEEEFAFVYNRTGSEDDFSDRNPALAIYMIKGLSEYDMYVDTLYWNQGMTSALVLENCQDEDQMPPCVLDTMDLYFLAQGQKNVEKDSFLNVKGEKTPFMFAGDPNDSTSSSMIAHGLEGFDGRVLMNSSINKYHPGEWNKMQFAIYVTDQEAEKEIEVNHFKDKLKTIKESVLSNAPLIEGPSAPELKAESFVDKLELSFAFDEDWSNNKNKAYHECVLDPYPDSAYVFEGVKLYQVSSPAFDPKFLDETDKAVLIYQGDLKNEVSSISNWEKKYINSQAFWEKELKVDGENIGIAEIITFDYDVLNDRALDRQSQYHFIAVSYGYIEGELFDTTTLIGNPIPYIEGRHLARVYSFGLNDQGEMLGAQITRLSGMGNMNDLRLTEASRKNVIEQFEGELTYEIGHGPFDVVVLEASKISDDMKLRLEVDGDVSPSDCAYALGSTNWILTELNSGTVITSDFSLAEMNAQLVEEYGFIIDVRNQNYENLTEHPERSINSTVSSSSNWLTQEKVLKAIMPIGSPLHMYGDFDPYNLFVENNESNFYPVFSFNPEGDKFSISPIQNRFSDGLFSDLKAYENLNNVNIVLTEDKSKWSRCIVVESAHNSYQEAGFDSQGEQNQINLRDSEAIDKNGKPDGSGRNGMSWFPGFAYDVETGRRLNIFFGENSALYANKNMFEPNICRDLIFNPSGETIIDAKDYHHLLKTVMGGQHYVFVTRQDYDGCEKLYQSLNNPSVSEKIKGVTWIGLPLVSKGNSWNSISEGLIPYETTIRLRARNNFSPTRYQDELSFDSPCKMLNDNPVYNFNFVPLPSKVNESNNVYFEVKTGLNYFEIKNTSEELNLELYDSNGRLVQRRNVPKGSHAYQYNLNDVCSNGIYFMRVIEKSSNRSKSFKIPVVL